MVKRVLTKGKIDRQMSGQSSTTPFMKASDRNYSSMKNSRKGMTFDAIETIVRYSNCIDKLTSLVCKMNVKIDKQKALHKPQIYQDRPRGQSRNRQNNYQSRNRSFSSDRHQNINRGNYNRKNYRSNFRDRSRDNYMCDSRRNNYRLNDRHDNYRANDR